MAHDEIPLVEAALRLGMGYQRALNALLTGELTGRRNDRGRWMVSVESVTRSATGSRHAAAVGSKDAA